MCFQADDDGSQLQVYVCCLCSVLFGHVVVEAASCSGAEDSSSLVLESLRGVLTPVSWVKGKKPVAEGKTVINTLPFHLFPFLGVLCRSCSC